VGGASDNVVTRPNGTVGGLPIDGLDDGIRAKVHNIFMASWAYFHQPVFTAAHFLDPQAIDLSSEQRTELYNDDIV
jgi:hypothetical protein